MYQLEISGPRGRQIVRWEPRKLRELDAKTIAAVAEAERLFQEALAYNRTRTKAGDALVPHMAVCGRWTV
jgi:hypothetical protein